MTRNWLGLMSFRIVTVVLVAIGWHMDRWIGAIIAFLFCAYFLLPEDAK